jgi:Fic family protein
MKIESFRAGTWKRQYQYKSFSPVFINQAWTWEDARINILLEQASQALARLDAHASLIPDVDTYIRLHVVKEAQTSSHIEGTQTTLDEAAAQEEFIAPERRNDWQEVGNYTRALNEAVAILPKLPVSNRLLKQAHGRLLQGVRGRHKQPGEFRTSQNWIGGTGPNDAVFIPPHHDEVPELMSDLEKFWHNEAIAVPHLVRVAISHYQIETIHPFLDGNGRIGRLFIPLYLISKNQLTKPCLYLSSYLERHKGAYFDALTTVRASNDLGHWVRFFLVAVSESANQGVHTFESILALAQECRQKILRLGRKAPRAEALLKLLWATPHVNARMVAEQLSVSHQTAIMLLRVFAKEKIVSEIKISPRNTVFVFFRYLALFEKRP